MDYPIVLTSAEPGPFAEPTPKEELALKLDDAWLACCAVWWFLFFRGITAELLLFKITRFRMRWGWHARIAPITQWWRRWRLSLKGESAEQLVVVPDEDDIPF